MRSIAALALVLFGCAAAASETKNDAPASDAPASDDVAGTISSTGTPTSTTTSSHGDAGDAAVATCAAGYFADQTLEVGNATRRYDVFVPANARPDAPLPIVLTFHGDDGVSLRAPLGLEKVTGNDAIVVYPHGDDNQWRLAKPDGNADYAFVEALKAELVASRCGDAARTFGIGMSNGAFFLNQMACYRGTAVFRGIVSHSGGLYAPDGVTAKYDDATGALVCPAPPPAALVIHGQKDTTVPYESTGKNTRDSWVYNDGCNATKTAAFAPSPCASYTTCSKNGAAFCGVPNLAHAVWSGAAAASWAFLSKL